jgi:16S rRNA (guanine966-N2)-methyltransferase
MRIIAGVHRGRKILSPSDASTTRPIPDRVKQSLFDRLWSMGLLADDPFEAFEQKEGIALDLFCGTGSMGIEALSRGVGRCIFIDQDRDAISQLNENLKTLDLTSRSQVLLTSALSPSWLNMLGRDPLRIAFIDPPYALLEDTSQREQLTAVLGDLRPHLDPEGLAMVRTSKECPPLLLPGWEQTGRHPYGSTVLNFYAPQPA